MKGFVAGVIVTLVCIIGAAYIFLAGGFAPVATASRPMPFEKQLATRALDAKVQKEMPKTVPIEGNEVNYLVGAHEYVNNCAVCHGVPGKEKTAIAFGEFPTPPQLFNGKGVSGDPAGETYWKVANGIRLTGMPSFNKILSQTEMWQISLLLANSDKLPDPVTAVLAGQPETLTPKPAAVIAHPASRK